jgi:hypothetical protein
MPSPNIRYIVRNVEEAVSFFTQTPWIHRRLSARSRFRDRGPRRRSIGSQCRRWAGRCVAADSPTGDIPEPGGWNRNTIVSGIGGKQILVEDPSGKPDRHLRAQGLARGHASSASFALRAIKLIHTVAWALFCHCHPSPSRSRRGCSRLAWRWSAGLSPPKVLRPRGERQ